MRILCLFISLILGTTVSFCQVDMYAPNQDLLKKYKIKKYSKTTGQYIKGSFIGTSGKYNLNKHGMVLYEDYDCANVGCFSKVIYEYINDTILISKTQYPYPYNPKNHFRIYQYKYSDSMILKEEIVFDSLDNIESKYIYNTQGHLEKLTNFYPDTTIEMNFSYQFEEELPKFRKYYVGTKHESNRYYVYDKNENLISQHERWVNGEMFFSKQYKYDKEQRLIYVRQVSNGNYKDGILDTNGISFDDVLSGYIKEDFIKYDKKGLLKEVVYKTNGETVLTYLYSYKL
ncbi:MAG TPA: hypothetical protein VK169_12195 [Saprospiraceae bacterium]|nr:hypothetical protein [Saprospiraceae bacterium]